MKLYVATIELKYEVMAVATTEAMAVEMVTAKAYAYLKSAKALTPETNTPARIGDYFGVTVTVATLDGPGVHVGNPF